MSDRESENGKLLGHRPEFLLQMYRELHEDITRHIMVVWQPIAVVFGSLALVFVESKTSIAIDYTTALAVVLVGWLLGTLYDSSYWYNRNLAMVTNLERLFLRREDLRHVHYYFGKHRKTGSMMSHLRIQWYMGILLGLVALSRHALTTMIPILGSAGESESLEIAQALVPYVVAIVTIWKVVNIRNNRNASYREFLSNSPGVPVDTKDIVYGVGHPVDAVSKTKQGGDAAQ